MAVKDSKEHGNMAASAAPAIRIDDDGDLTLVIGPDKRDFVVCSRDLTRASRVFKCMLDGGYRESRPASESSGSWWVVTLPEDDEGAAKLVLSIVHAVFDHIPAILPLAGLHDALVFSEKYDMTKYFRPWIKGWVPPQSVFVQSTEYARVIGVAYELGIKDALELVAKRLCVECEVDGGGQLVGLDSIPIEQSGMALNPPGIYENAAAIRLALVTYIFQRLRYVVLGLNKLTQDSTPGGPFSTPGCSKPEQCHAMNLGSIIGGLGRLELQVLWCSDDELNDLGISYLPSVNHLVQMIKNIKVVRRAGKTKKNHTSCNPIIKLLGDIEARLASRDSPVTTEHLAYLERQQSKLGVLSTEVVGVDGTMGTQETQGNLEAVVVDAGEAVTQGTVGV